MQAVPPGVVAVGVEFRLLAVLSLVSQLLAGVPVAAADASPLHLVIVDVAVAQAILLPAFSLLLLPALQVSSVVRFVPVLAVSF